MHLVDNCSPAAALASLAQEKIARFARSKTIGMFASLTQVLRIRVIGLFASLTQFLRISLTGPISRI